MMKGGATIYNP